MKENIKNISVLVPSEQKTQIPSLGYASIRSVLNQAFPDVEINPIYLDSVEGLETTDVLVSNFYSTLGFVDLLRVLDNQGFSTQRSKNPFVNIIGGTGALNPLPIKETVDYITLKEGNLVRLISVLSGKEPREWKHPDPIWVKTDYITLIMPTLSCVYKCTFCQLKNQNDGKMTYSELDRIREVIDKEKPSRILVHSATILQYPKFEDLTTLLDESGATIYLGSMNLIDINIERAHKLMKLKPKHTIATEKEVDVQLYFGLESGSREILRTMRKPLTPEIAIQRVNILRNAGFKHIGFYLIVGYPNTDKKEFDETVSLLNTLANVMKDGKLSVKCTPFIPHLGTEDSPRPARRWSACIRELNWIRSLTLPNVSFDISEALYYLTSVALIRGGSKHSRLLDLMVRQKNLKIEDDEDIELILRELSLPNLNSHLNSSPPIDLSASGRPYINTQDL